MSTASHAPTRVRTQPRVAIIGAGMSGMLMGIRLKQAGYEDFTIYEKAEEVGGTWRENTYPGLACDVPAHYYTYTFELNPEWRHRFARGWEIQRYLAGVADKYGLRPHIRFGQEMSHGYHDGQQWRLRSAQGLAADADIVVAATGVLHHPKYPDIEGLDSFAGPCFHSARWDHDVDLRGKRVGLIGTGSTGVQIGTALGMDGQDLTVFQRTPQWIFPMPDRDYGKVGRWLYRRFPVLAKLIYRGYELSFENVFSNAVIDRDSWQYKLIDRILRWHLNRVTDPELRRKLTPTYAPMCKRMIMSWDYYNAMQRDNVHLVTEGIERVVPEGVVTSDGKTHELDVLILATGFRAHDYLQPMELETAAGKRLSETWRGSPTAYRSVAVPGFPNFFMIVGPKSPIGNYSLISIAETQVEYIMQCVDELAARGLPAMSPRADVTAKLEHELTDAMGNTVWVTGCNSWYLDANGVPDTWPSTPKKFREYLRQPRTEEFEVQP